MGNQSKLGGRLRLMKGSWEKYASNGWQQDIVTLLSIFVNTINYAQLYPKSLIIWSF